MAVKMFICYAHKDELLLLKLMTHLRPMQHSGRIEPWHDREIRAGTEWGQELSNHFNAAQVILLLVSPDFVASDYCYGVEMNEAIERHESGKAHVIPVLLRHTLWQETPLGKLQVLPSNAKPIRDRSWHSPDEAFLNVAEGIRTLIEKIDMQDTANLLAKQTEASQEIKVERLKEKYQFPKHQNSDSNQKVKQEIAYKFRKKVAALNRRTKLIDAETGRYDQSNGNQNRVEFPKTFEEMDYWFDSLSNRERCFVQATAVLHGASVYEVSKAANELCKPIGKEADVRKELLLARTFTTIRRVGGTERLYWQDANIDGLSFFGARVLMLIAHEAALEGLTEQGFLDHIERWPKKLQKECSWRSAQTLGSIWWVLDTSHFWWIANAWSESNEPEDWQNVVNLLMGAFEAVSIIEGGAEQKASRSQLLKQVRSWAGGDFFD